MFFPDRCIGCSRCLTVCPRRAHIIQEGAHVYLRQKCMVCGRCTETCYAGALMFTGKSIAVDEVVEEVLRDSIFYEISGGGVTLSGGDPVLQHDFSQAVLDRCKTEGLHTAIETAANCRWIDLVGLLPVTDLIMIDIKHLNFYKHRKVTGVSSKLVLENAQRLAQINKPIIVRIPIVPTVNDTPEEIEAIVQFVGVFQNLQYLELLPFHRLGESKYHSLGLNYQASHLKTPTKKKMSELAGRAKESGIKVRIG